MYFFLRRLLEDVLHQNGILVKGMPQDNTSLRGLDWIHSRLKKEDGGSQEKKWNGQPDRFAHKTYRERLWK